jgi:PII-like signaling protein
MNKKLKTHTVGKLRIYLKTGDTIKSKSLLRKLFPKSIYWQIVEEAKKSGLMNAHVFHTQAAYTQGDKIHKRNLENDNSGLTVCVELVDMREKLEHFFKTHQPMLKGKTIIYKEVEFWDLDE